MGILIGAAFVLILGALGMAGVFMVRGSSGNSKRGNMMRALAVRIAVSVVLFACIVIAWQAGWIQPTGVPLTR